MRSQIGIEADCPSLTAAPKGVKNGQWAVEISQRSLFKVFKCFCMSRENLQTLLHHSSQFLIWTWDQKLIGKFRKRRRQACAVSELPVSAPRAFCGNQTQTSPVNLTMHRHCTPAQCDLEKSSCGRIFVFRTRVSVGGEPWDPSKPPHQADSSSNDCWLCYPVSLYQKLTETGWKQQRRFLLLKSCSLTCLSIIWVFQTKLFEIEMW